MTTPDNKKSDAATRRAWIVHYLANLLSIELDQVSVAKGLGDYGLDSVDAMVMAGEMGTHFGVEIDPADFTDFDTLQEMLDSWDSFARPA